jgi:ketosteroid isomerase-like protein
MISALSLREEEQWYWRHLLPYPLSAHWPVHEDATGSCSPATTHRSCVPSRMQGGSWVERIKKHIDQDIMGLENRHTTIDQIIAAADKVVTVTTTTGTRKGKQVSYSAMTVTRYADGKMVESWDLWDRLGVYQQLGVISETPELMKQAGLEA